MSDTLLTMRNISKRFGATQALKDVHFDVKAGKILALVGENGAGKSTLMKVLSGAHSPDSGAMQLCGKPYSPAGPHEARLAGISMIYQELNLAPDLSVEDNIMLGREDSVAGFLSRSEQYPRVRDALAKLGHPGLKPHTLVRELSIAAQQLVEIARALVFDSKVVVFDEPTSSLTQHDVRHLFKVINQLKEQGLGIIYISHFLEEVREIGDEYAVLRDGESVGSGSLEGTSEEDIVRLMVGRDVNELFPQVPHTPGETVVQISNLSGEKIPRKVELNIRRGEILGISGLVGAGRTELIRCMYGLDPIRTGQVKVNNIDVRPTPANMIERGIGIVSEDRKQEGLAQNCSISDNITFSNLAPYSSFGLLNLNKRYQAVLKWMQKLQVKAHSPEQMLVELSGGNQQKVALARVMHQEADIFLFDEPTRGIDVGTKSEIYRQMGELAAQDKAIVFVSSYLTELLAVCDRIAVMSRGQLLEVRPRADWTEESLMSVAISGEAL
ncbi:Ribose import ATP-binding protein RbsA [Polystyrenella longa]|uniref:Ribose import ATP-binding protein RbsA n=1 Tax=Polystyrenella longa TaxID=2528007 RepID=A0A518CPF1_9PLAN|nr:sugar ABC transporter ATP-binding protein [Polystyrenella longa]QDU81100.1 Ribose import ATP-binding protein RbsA [Polystyrenella longa]